MVASGRGRVGKGEGGRLGHTWLRPESRCREREPLRALHLPLAGISRTYAPARQVGGVDRVPRKDEVSAPWPSPMHRVTRGLQVDNDRSLYDKRSRTVVATCLTAAAPVLDRASVQLCVVLVVAGGSWRCASLSATLRIPLWARGSPTGSFKTRGDATELVERWRVLSSTVSQQTLISPLRLGGNEGSDEAKGRLYESSTIVLKKVMRGGKSTPRPCSKARDTSSDQNLDEG